LTLSCQLVLLLALRIKAVKIHIATRSTRYIKPDYRKDEVQRADKIVKRLRTIFPNAKCTLQYDNPFQLLIGVILQARSIGQSINFFTQKLIEAYPNPEVLMSAKREAIEEIIRPTGYARQKSKYLIEMARALVENHEGIVPDKLAEIARLPGLTRNSASLIVGELFGEAEGIYINLPILRVVNRLEFTSGQYISKAEKDLMRIVPRENWTQLPFLITSLSNTNCQVEQPRCRSCLINDICHFSATTGTS